MGFENFSNIDTNKKTEALESDCVTLLWEKLEKLGDEKDLLKKEAEGVYNLNRGRDLMKLNLHEREIYGENEKKYWDLEERVKEITSEENEVSLMIEKIEKNELGEKDLRDIIQSMEKGDEDSISKKKKRILEERERMGIDPREVDYGFAGGPQVAKPATGRNLKSIKGNMSLLEAEGVFYDKTADTHGGKVGHGKKANIYAGKGGKNIRKK